MPTKLFATWGNLNSIYTKNDVEFVEIDLTNFSNQTQKRVIEYLFERAKEVQTSFIIPGTRVQIDAASPSAAAEALVKGRIVGAIGISIPALPMITIFVDAPGKISISYSPFDNWQPISVIALMDLLHRITEIEPRVNIGLDDKLFSGEQSQLFDDAFREFMNETI